MHMHLFTPYFKNTWVIFPDAYNPAHAYNTLTHTQAAPQTKDEYQTALIEWHKVGLNVYMLESQGPHELDKGAIKSFFDQCNEPSAPESWRENFKVYQWWRYDSDWDEFPPKMLWGQPHRAKEAWRRSATAGRSSNTH